MIMVIYITLKKDSEKVFVLGNTQKNPMLVWTTKKSLLEISQSSYLSYLQYLLFLIIEFSNTTATDAFFRSFILHAYPDLQKCAIMKKYCFDSKVSAYKYY